MKKHTLFLGLAFFATIQAAEKPETKAEEKLFAAKEGSKGLDFASANTYYGQAITPENILQLAPKPNPKLVASVQEYLKSHPALTRLLSGSLYYEPLDREKLGDVAPFNLSFYDAEKDKDPAAKEAFKALRVNTLKEAGIDPAKLSGSNYNIPFGEDWLIKASSRANRIENINSSVGNKYGAAPTQEQLEQFKKMTDGGKTYQTISRVAYILRAKEAKKKLGLKRMGLPKQYLVHIPGRPTEVEDQNYVVIEKRIKGAKDFEDSPLAVDKELIEQFTKAIGYTALWDLSAHNVLITEADGKFWIIDPEQPNVHKPLDFFHKDMQVHRSNVEHGWGELVGKVIEPYAKEHNVDAKDIKELRDAMHKVQDEITATWQDK